MLVLLQRPEYLHVLINPLPLYGLAMGILALAIGLLIRNRAAQTLALWLVIISAVSAGPVYLFGQRGYNSVYLLADSDGQVWLDKHMHRAEKLIYVYYVLAAVAAAALFAPSRFLKSAAPLTAITLALACATLTAGGWIAYPGGKVRHPEFREPSRSGETNGHSTVTTNAEPRKMSGL